MSCPKSPRAQQHPWVPTPLQCTPRGCGVPGGVGTASGAVRSVTGSHPGPRPRHSPGCSPPTPKPAGKESPGEGGGRGDRDVTPLARAVPAPYLAWEVFQQLLDTRALQQQRWVSVQPPTSPEGPRVSPRTGDTAVPSPVPTAWDMLGLGPLVPARWGPSPPIVPLGRQQAQTGHGDSGVGTRRGTAEVTRLPRGGTAPSWALLPQIPVHGVTARRGQKWPRISCIPPMPLPSQHPAQTPLSLGPSVPSPPAPLTSTKATSTKATNSEATNSEATCGEEPG